MGRCAWPPFVSGAGSGGVRAGRLAAASGRKVAVAEEYRVGGTCVIRGCVPKKFMVYASEFPHYAHIAEGFGWSASGATFDWTRFREAKDREIARLSGLYVANLTRSGAEIIEGRAVLTGPNSLEVEGRGAVTAERILIASECIGDARFFIDRASAYAKERSVFGRPIGQNQGVQFPIARAYIQTTAAAQMVADAAAKFDAGEGAGTEANMAKLLASEASWFAADMCVQTHGGFGFACEYDVERKFRETRLYQVAPISTNLILSYVSEHVLGLPRSY